MAVRSKRLGGPLVVGTSEVEIHLTPVGETHIVKWLTIYKTATTPAAVVRFSIGNMADAVTIGAFQLSVAQRSLQAEVWWVLQPQDGLHVVSDQSVTVSVHGAELEGVAD